MSPHPKQSPALRRIARSGEILFRSRRKVATAAAGLLAVMVGYHVVFGQNGILAFQSKLHTASELKLEVETMRRENEKLRAHVNRLTEDPNAIEHQAREELHYTRPGEVILSMPPESETHPQPVLEPGSPATH